MNKNSMWIWAIFIALGLISLASCHEDLSTIGSEVIGSETPYGILDDSHSVKAYSQKMNPVQTNRLDAYRLGTYNDPNYGKTTSNLLTQLLLGSNDPKFGEEATVDSVEVYLPYFATEIPRDTTMTYKLDSIYGNSPINISVFESGYYLRAYDPESGFERVQPYYSNQGAEFDNFLGAEIGRIEGFKPSEKGYIFNKGEDNEERIAPGLRMMLSKDFFQQKIIAKEGSAELRNNNNFRNYFRGLYFKVDSPDSNGNLFMFDPSKAYVQIYYSYLDDKDEKKQKRLKLNFASKNGGVIVNTFDNAPLPGNIENEVANPNRINGNQNLYMRGGDGIMTVVELFGDDLDNNGVPDELELLRSKRWMLNEANLIFYVNQDIMTGGASEPERISIYNLRTNQLLVDYLVDPTNGMKPIDAFTQHLGRLERGTDQLGKFYRLRITNHVSNLINKDSINAPLGVVVSQNVKDQNFQNLSSPQDPQVKKIPAGSVMSPKGTILHGNLSTNPEKRLKLQIYYTEPN